MLLVCSAVFPFRMLMNSWCRSYLLSALLLSAALVFGQGTRTGSEYGSLASHDRLQVLKRETWLRHGRLVPGQSPVELRYRAYRQKLQLRVHGFPNETHSKRFGHRVHDYGQQ
jgi:hypothetical protein